MDLAFEAEGLLARFQVPLAMLSHTTDEPDDAPSPRSFRRAS